MPPEIEECLPVAIEECTTIEACLPIALSRLRKRRGLTQAEVASELSLSEQAISKYETGTVSPTLAVACKILALYRFNLHALQYEIDHLRGTQPHSFFESASSLEEAIRHLFKLARQHGFDLDE